MAWIESHTVLPRHRKVAHAALLLGMDPAHFLGCLHCLWHSALEQQEDGDLTRWPDAFTAHAASFKGDPAAWVAALREAGWLDGSRLHDWLDYAGRFLESRYRTSDPDRLIRIWAIHGKQFTKVPGKLKAQSGNSQTEDSPPNPPTKPTLPNHIPRKDGQEGGFGAKGVTTAKDLAADFHVRQGKGALTPEQAGEQDRLLNLRMPFGELKGTHVISLPADRCAWLLAEWPGRHRLGTELKKALELRVKLKQEESNA